MIVLTSTVQGDAQSSECICGIKKKEKKFSEMRNFFSYTVENLVHAAKFEFFESDKSLKQNCTHTHTHTKKSNFLESQFS